MTFYPKITHFYPQIAHFYPPNRPFLGILRRFGGVKVCDIWLHVLYFSKLYSIELRNVKFDPFHPISRLKMAQITQYQAKIGKFGDF